MKKSLIALMILAVTTTSFIGCSKKGNSDKSESNNPVVSEEDTSTENEENTTSDESNNNSADTGADTSEDTITGSDNTSTDNSYSEAEMEEIAAVTTEQIAEYAREVGQKYYDYKIDLEVIKKVDGINLYHFVINGGPPNNTEKEYMLGADGNLYNYEAALNGILEIED